MNKIFPDAVVRWRFLRPEDEGWKSLQCLYAYLAPNKKEILYIGKAWGVTARARWNRAGKENFWHDLEKQRKIFKHFVLLGNVNLTYRGQLTEKLLADIESLLIMGEKPWGNILSKKSRISRPGLIVKCEGEWPGKVKFYIDNG